MNLARNSLGRWVGDFVAMMPDDLAVVLGDDPIAYLAWASSRHVGSDCLNSSCGGVCSQPYLSAYTSRGQTMGATSVTRQMC
jgi:hypothetical protein